MVLAKPRHVPKRIYFGLALDLGYFVEQLDALWKLSHLALELLL